VPVNSSRRSAWRPQEPPLSKPSQRCTSSTASLNYSFAIRSTARDDQARPRDRTSKASAVGFRPRNHCCVTDLLRWVAYHLRTCRVQLDADCAGPARASYDSTGGGPSVISSFPRAARTPVLPKRKSPAEAGLKDKGSLSNHQNVGMRADSEKAERLRATPGPSALRPSLRVGWRGCPIKAVQQVWFLADYGGPGCYLSVPACDMTTPHVAG
jgi:hypothetical protein